MTRATSPLDPRDRFREYALDGANLYFHPRTGTHVRIAHATTAAQRRRAPRVAMFGITNVCNLRCAFCSRDETRPSLWTVETATAALQTLAQAGTLEVAFGGGEPFAFRGFGELIEELYATTTLALHVTTNGTLLEQDMWGPFAGRLGQVRLSVYDDETWRAAAEMLNAAGQQWGVNLLVDDTNVAQLPRALAAFADAGCHDVSLLSYVGVDRVLSPAGKRMLANHIARSPVRCRLSVCLGDGIGAPRLFGGVDNDGDCGAGYDFVSITPDQRVQSCSFQDSSTPARTGEEILSAWSRRRGQWTLPSPRSGCARQVPLAGAPTPLPPIAVWQSFSGNNSGECILVAKFRSVEDAEGYLAELMPGWTGKDDPYSAQWRELFTKERVAGATLNAEWNSRDSPKELLSLGTSVFALGYAADDAFPELRALAWKRGAYVVPGGIHVHDPSTLLVALRGKSRADMDPVAQRARTRGIRVHVHDDVLWLRLALGGAGAVVGLDSLAAASREITTLAEGRRLSAELVFDAISDADMNVALTALATPAETSPRLWVSFWSYETKRAHEEALRFAESLHDESATVVGSSVLIDPARGRKRLAVLAYRRDGYVQALDGTEVTMWSSFWMLPPPPRKGTRAPRVTVDAQALEAALRRDLRGISEFQFEPAGRNPTRPIRVTFQTSAPTPALAVLNAAARDLNCSHNVSLSDVAPLAWAVRRLWQDVHAGGR